MGAACSVSKTARHYVVDFDESNRKEEPVRMISFDSATGTKNRKIVGTTEEIKEIRVLPKTESSRNMNGNKTLVVIDTALDGATTIQQESILGLQRKFKSSKDMLIKKTSFRTTELKYVHLKLKYVQLRMASWMGNDCGGFNVESSVFLKNSQYLLTIFEPTHFFINLMQDPEWRDSSTASIFIFAPSDESKQMKQFKKADIIAKSKPSHINSSLEVDLQPHQNPYILVCSRANRREGYYTLLLEGSEEFGWSMPNISTPWFEPPLPNQYVLLGEWKTNYDGGAPIVNNEVNERWIHNPQFTLKLFETTKVFITLRKKSVISSKIQLFIVKSFKKTGPFTKTTITHDDIVAKCDFSNNADEVSVRFYAQPRLFPYIIIPVCENPGMTGLFELEIQADSEVELLDSSELEHCELVFNGTWVAKNCGDRGTDNFFNNPQFFFTVHKRVSTSIVLNQLADFGNTTKATFYIYNTKSAIAPHNIDHKKLCFHKPASFSPTLKADIELDAGNYVLIASPGVAVCSKDTPIEVRLSFLDKSSISLATAKGQMEDFDTNEFFELKVDDKWTKSTSGGNQESIGFLNNPQYLLEFEEAEAKVEIVVDVKPSLFFRTTCFYLLDASERVTRDSFSPDMIVFQSKLLNNSMTTVSAKIILPSTKFILLVSSCNIGYEGEFSVKVLSSCTVSLTKLQIAYKQVQFTGYSLQHIPRSVANSAEEFNLCPTFELSILKTTKSQIVYFRFGIFPEVPIPPNSFRLLLFPAHSVPQLGSELKQLSSSTESLAHIYFGLLNPILSPYTIIIQFTQPIMTKYFLQIKSEAQISVVEKKNYVEYEDSEVISAEDIHADIYPLEDKKGASFIDLKVVEDSWVHFKLNRPSHQDFFCLDLFSNNQQLKTDQWLHTDFTNSTDVSLKRTIFLKKKLDPYVLIVDGGTQLGKKAKYSLQISASHAVAIKTREAKVFEQTFSINERPYQSGGVISDLSNLDLFCKNPYVKFSCNIDTELTCCINATQPSSNLLYCIYVYRTSNFHNPNLNPGDLKEEALVCQSQWGTLHEDLSISCKIETHFCYYIILTCDTVSILSQIKCQLYSTQPIQILDDGFSSNANGIVPLKKVVTSKFYELRWHPYLIQKNLEWKNNYPTILLSNHSSSAASVKVVMRTPIPLACGFIVYFGEEVILETGVQTTSTCERMFSIAPQGAVHFVAVCEQSAISKSFNLYFESNTSIELEHTNSNLQTKLKTYENIWLQCTRQVLQSKYLYKISGKGEVNAYLENPTKNSFCLMVLDSKLDVIVQQTEWSSQAVIPLQFLTLNSSEEEQVFWIIPYAAVYQIPFTLHFYHSETIEIEDKSIFNANTLLSFPTTSFSTSNIIIYEIKTEEPVTLKIQITKPNTAIQWIVKQGNADISLAILNEATSEQLDHISFEQVQQLVVMKEIGEYRCEFYTDNIGDSCHTLLSIMYHPECAQIEIPPVNQLAGDYVNNSYSILMENVNHLATASKGSGLVVYGDYTSVIQTGISCFARKSLCHQKERNAIAFLSKSSSEVPVDCFEPLIASCIFGKGKIVVSGDQSIFSQENMTSHLDNRQLLKNCFQWLSSSEESQGSTITAIVYGVKAAYYASTISTTAPSIAAENILCCASLQELYELLGDKNRNISLLFLCPLCHDNLVANSTHFVSLLQWRISHRGMGLLLLINPFAQSVLSLYELYHSFIWNQLLQPMGIQVTNSSVKQNTEDNYEKYWWIRIYLPPNAVVQFEFPSDWVCNNNFVRIGFPSDDLWISHDTPLIILPENLIRIPITQPIITVTSHSGGNIYLELNTCQQKEQAQITIVTNQIVNYTIAKPENPTPTINTTVPYMDWIGKKVIFSIPTKWNKLFSNHKLREVIDVIDQFFESWEQVTKISLPFKIHFIPVKQLLAPPVLSLYSQYTILIEESHWMNCLTSNHRNSNEVFEKVIREMSVWFVKEMNGIMWRGRSAAMAYVLQCYVWETVLHIPLQEQVYFYKTIPKVKLHCSSTVKSREKLRMYRRDAGMASMMESVLIYQFGWTIFEECLWSEANGGTNSNLIVAKTNSTKQLLNSRKSNQDLVDKHVLKFSEKVQQDLSSYFEAWGFTISNSTKLYLQSNFAEFQWFGWH